MTTTTHALRAVRTISAIPRSAAFAISALLLLVAPAASADPALSNSQAEQEVRSSCAGEFAKKGKCGKCVNDVLKRLKKQHAISGKQSSAIKKVFKSECKGECILTSCDAEGATCGSIDDECGGALACGGCPVGQTCGGGGQSNTCGCAPTTCAAQGKDCGSIPDGCGATLACGGCGAGAQCGGLAPNVCCAPPSYSAEVLADNPAGYWRLGEGSGAVAADSSGSGLHGAILASGVVSGTTLGQSSLVAGDADTSMGFIDGGVLVPTQGPLVFSLANSLTVEAWVQTTDTGLQMAFSQQYCWYETVQLQTTASGAVFRVTEGAAGIGERGTVVVSSVSVTDGLPHHLVGVRDPLAHTMSIYVDGVLSNVQPDTTFTTGTLTSNPTETWIGRRYSCGAINPFRGKLDEVAVYNAALSPARVWAHYQASLGVCIAP